MVERGSGSIVNVASRLGQMGVRRDRGLQRRQGGAHRPDPGARPRVRAARDPGQRRRAGHDRHRDDRRTSPRARRAAGGCGTCRSGRFGRADEVADAVVFLLSDASSLFLGQTLNPNAGGYMP